MSVNERIKEIREALQRNPTQFSADIGVPRTTLLGWEGGKSVPIETAGKIGKAFPQVDIRWLLTGDGQMFNRWTFGPEAGGVIDLSEEISFHLPADADGAPAVPALREASLPECEDSELVGARIEGARSIEMAQGAPEEERVYVEFFSSQAAGAGPAQEIEAFQPITPQEIIKRFINPWRPDQVKAIEVRGDSMTKVGLFDRDIVLFVPKEKEGDGIFVISIENRMQVKRLEFDLLGKTLRIISENDRYAPRVLTTEEEMARVVIEGKVVGWLHKHPY